MDLLKKVMACLLLIAMGAGLIGCGQGETAGEKKEQKAVRAITIGVMPDVESIPFILAEKNGYFDEEGVKVKLVHFKSAKDRDSALQGGQLDGVVTDVLAVAFANEGGIPLKMVSRNDGNISLLAGKNTGIKSIADLRGRSIGLSTNTIMEYTLDRMLEAGGINPSKVKKIAIPPIPARFEMLESGKIDAAIMPEPFASLAVKNGARVLNSTDLMGNKAGAIAFTAEVLAKNPEEIRAVMKAYNRAVGFIKSQSAENYMDFVVQKQDFPAEVKNTLQLPDYKKAVLPEPRIVEDVLKWMKERKLINKDYEYKDLVYDGAVR